MSHTNSTTNYNLPQFITTDKPAWLTDVNNAYSAIDTAINTAQTKADSAYTNAGNAQIDATTAINNAAAADAKGSGAIASIEAAFDPTTIYSVGAKVMYNSLLYRCIDDVTTPGPWTGAANWERITVDSIIPANAGNLPLGSTAPAGSTAEAIAQLKNSKITPQAILTDTPLTLAATDYNTISGRTFSDYDLLIFKMGNSLADTRRTVVLPASIWTSGCVINEGVLHGSSAATPSSYQYSSFSLTYKSDTAITALVSGSGTISHLAIYGLKITQ